MATIVVAERLPKDSVLLENQFFRFFSTSNLIEDFEKAHSIFIKPNLTYPTYRRGGDHAEGIR